jgi:cbb3-type cytochrome oxidase cytochrome c subunit
MAKVTNLSKATEIVKTGFDARTPKKEILETLVRELGVKRGNAFVYFTKASKILDISITDGMRKSAKPKAEKVNKVTETSPEKAAKKVAEIDAVIANLKASGARVASPFAQLGA